MPLYLTARNPTDSLGHGFLPAAARLGLTTVVLTDRPEAHRAPCAGPAAVVGARVDDPGEVAARVRELSAVHGPPQALLSNSDHLQAATALAAELLGLPAKPWRAAIVCKNKLLTRRVLADAGLDTVAVAEVAAEVDPAERLDAIVAAVPFPAVVKPREGVASEGVVLVRDRRELAAALAAVRAQRPGAALLVEEYLDGPLYTYDTLGDGLRRHHFGSWRTALGPPPSFTETRLDWAPDLPAPVRADLDAQLDALGVGPGACHTEFVRQGDRARIVEVNYRLIGDLMDLICADLLGVDLFAAVIGVHRGEPVPAAVPAARTGGRHARVDYVVADRAGRLADAPPDGTWVADGVMVGHRRLRAPGTVAELQGSNRDYLAAVWAIGDDAARVHAAVREFRAAHRWPIVAATVRPVAS